MITKRWRDVLEVAAVVSVLGGLLLVAYEIRQANRIATAQIVLDLSSQYNELNLTRLSNPDFASFAASLQNSERDEISATQASMMTGTAYYLHNVLWSAQVAHDNGLLSREELSIYRNDMSTFLKAWPALVPVFVRIYQTDPGKQDAYVFEPLAEIVADLRAGDD